jgi:microcin C transport system substrate-binding protein
MAFDWMNPGRRDFMRFAAALAAAPATAWPFTGAHADDEVWRGHAIGMWEDPKHGPDFTHFDWVNPDAPKGGEVVQHVIGTFDTFHAFSLKGNPAPTGSVETLMTTNLDESSTEYGLLAGEIAFPKDRSWVEFTLRPEARWHDGEPVSVDDVIFSLEMLKTKGHPRYRAYYQSIVKGEAVGEHTVRLVFENANNRELPLIAGQMPIFPKHFWEGRDFEKTLLEPPLGSGPYRVESFDIGRTVTLVRVEDYWGRDLAVNRGLNNPDRIRYDFYRDRVVAFEAFKAGAYDFRQESISKQWATGYDGPALKSGDMQRAAIEHSLPTGMQCFVYNIRREKFQDPALREALAYAFDFEWSNTNLFYGIYSRPKSFFANSELASSGLPSEAELKILEPYRGRIPERVFTEEYQPPSTDGSGNIRGNLRTALGILRKAGWKIEDGKLIDPNTGKPLEIEFLISSPAFERIVLPFTQNLLRLGVTATVQPADTAQYRNRTDNFDFDITTEVFGQSGSPGNEQRDYWTTAAADQPGSRNMIGIKDPVIDELVDLLIAAPTWDDLVARCRALDRVLLWNHFVIPQWASTSFFVAWWNRFGRPERNPKNDVGFDSWWIDPELDAKLKRGGG